MNGTSVQEERSVCVLSVYIFMRVHLDHLALNDSLFQLYFCKLVCVLLSIYIVLNLLPRNRRTVTLVSCVKLSMTNKVLWLQYLKTDAAHNSILLTSCVLEHGRKKTIKSVLQVCLRPVCFFSNP